MKNSSVFLRHGGKILSIIFAILGIVALVIYFSSSKDSKPVKPWDKPRISETGRDVDNESRDPVAGKDAGLPRFADNEPVKITIGVGEMGFESGQINFLGQVKSSDITFDDEKVSDWVTFEVNETDKFIVLKNKDELAEGINSKEFNVVLSNGPERKHVIISFEHETKPAYVTWPQRENKTVNRNFDDLKNPLLFKLEGSGKVYGDCMSGSAVFSEGLYRQYNVRRIKGKPACVYNFGDADPVGEMHAIWDLGGRFLLVKDDGSIRRLGGEEAALEPEIMKDRLKGSTGLILEVNDAGDELLKRYCEAMSVTPGNLHITLPKKLWFAVYGTVLKKYNDSGLIDTLNTSGKKVGWMLKSYADSYAIIIQKPD